MTSTRNDGHRTVGVVPYSYDGKMTVFLLIPKPNLQSSELPEFSDFSSTVDEINGQYYSASNAFLTQFTGNQVTPQVTSIKKMSERLEKKVGSDQVMPFHNPTYQHICYFVEMNPKLRPGKPCMWVPVDEMLMHCSSKGFLTTRLTFSTDEINRLKSWLHHIDAKFKSGGAEAWDPPIPGPINEIKSSNTSPTPPNPPVNTPTVNINTINTTATYPVLNKLPLGMSTNTNTIDITTPRTEALGLPSVAPSTPKYQFSSFNSTTPFSTAAITPTHSIRHPSPYNALPSSRCPSPSPFTNPYITASTPINYNSSDIRYTSPITMRPSSILDTNLTNSFTPLQFSTPLKTSTYGSDTPQRLLSLTNNSLPNTRFSSPVLRFQNDITPRVDSSLWNNGISPRISSWPSYSSNIPTSSYLATSASPAYTDYTKLTTNDTKSLYTQPISTSDLSYKYSVSSSDYISPLQQTGSWFPSNSQPSHTPLANWQPTNQIHSTSTLLSQPYSQGFNTPLTGNNVSYHQPQNTQNWGSTSAFPDIGTYGSTTTYF